VPPVGAGRKVTAVPCQTHQLTQEKEYHENVTYCHLDCSSVSRQGQSRALDAAAVALPIPPPCKVWTTPAGNVEKAKTDEGFAVFKIETIDNTKPSNSFNLDPERLYVDQTKAEMKSKNISFQVRRFINPAPRFAQAMGVKALERAAFPGNQIVDVNSYVVVPLATNNPTGGPEADQYSFDLRAAQV
jgi:hypothetical protein